MPSLLGQDSWNNPNYFADGLYWVTGFENGFTTPAGTQFFLAMFGGYAETNAYVSPDSPDETPNVEWDSAGSPQNLVKPVIAHVTVDLAPGTQIYCKDGPKIGSYDLLVSLGGTGKVYGAVLAAALVGVDLVTSRTYTGIKEAWSEENASGTSASHTASGNANDALFYVLAVKGAPAVTASGTVLANLVSTDGQCRVVFGWTSGTINPACSFSWSGSQYYSLATALVAGPLGGGQIAVIG